MLLGWGVTALIGGLLVDDVLAGRREVGEGIRRSALIKPVALGAVAIPVALSFVFSDELGGWWLWAVAAGFLYLVVALQLRAGGVSAAAYSLVALGIGALSASNDYSPIDEPWMFVAGAGVLGVVAFVLERLTANRDAWLGWDVAPLVVAHSLAAVGLVAAVPADAVPIVWSATGGLVLAFAIWKARVEWAVAGIALVLIGASVAGHGLAGARAGGDGRRRHDRGGVLRGAGAGVPAVARRGHHRLGMGRDRHLGGLVAGYRASRHGHRRRCSRPSHRSGPPFGLDR